MRTTLAVVMVAALPALADEPRADRKSAASSAETLGYLKHTMPIGNLGSITSNERRYAFSRDWTTMAAPQDSGSVLLFDVATGQPAPPLEGGFKVGTMTYLSEKAPPAYVFGLSDDGRFVFWSWGKKVVAWEVATRRVVLKQEIDGLLGQVRVSVDGRLLSWSTSAGPTLWDLSRGAAESTAGPMGEWAFSVLGTAGNPARSHDGRCSAVVNLHGDGEVGRLAGAGFVGVLPAREKGNRGRCAQFDFDRFLSRPALLWSRDCRILADSCRVTDVWDLSQPTPRLLVRTGLLRREAGRPILSADGRTLAYSWGGGSVLAGDGGFALLDVETASAIGPHVEVKDLGTMQFSPDGVSLATVGGVPRPGAKKTFEVAIWDVAKMRAAAGLTP